MRRFLLLFLFFGVFASMAFAGDDDIMITRDGAMLRVKIIRMSQMEVVFIDLDHRRRGELKAPADYVFMIMKDKGNNICFDEKGNQTTQPARELEKKETYLFMNDGRYFPIYNLSIKKDELIYQLKDKKKAPYYKSGKNEVFMLRNNDGTSTLFNDNYIKNHSKKKTNEIQAPAAQTPATTLPTASASASAPASNSAATNLLATSTTSLPKQFYPAPELPAAELESKVNSIMPYTLFRKGSVAEYVIYINGKQAQFFGGPTYVQQVVVDEKIENGLLVSYVQQLLFNKKHEPSKGIKAEFKSYYYPTEIDTAGNYHLTHDISRDFIMLSKRNGYAMIVPGKIDIGSRLNCSTINDDAKNLFGGKVKAKAEYKDFAVVGEEDVTTPAGTFKCIRLTGKVTETSAGSVSYNYTWWLARGIGFVKYEIRKDGDRKNSVTTILLNKVDIK